jgi:hypothetical protein
MGKRPDPMVALVKKRFTLWRDVVKIGHVIRGSVTVLRRPCTHPTCRVCASGRRHPATYLSMKEKGRTRLIYLPQEHVADARAMVREWKRLENLLLEVSKTNAEILRLLGQRDSAKRRKKS